MVGLLADEGWDLVLLTGGSEAERGAPEGPIAKGGARVIALAVAWMADGDCDYVTDDVPQILGRPAGSFERFAVDYAEAFS